MLWRKNNCVSEAKHNRKNNGLLVRDRWVPMLTWRWGLRWWCSSHARTGRARPKTAALSLGAMASARWCLACGSVRPSRRSWCAPSPRGCRLFCWPAWSRARRGRWTRWEGGRLRVHQPRAYPERSTGPGCKQGHVCAVADYEVHKNVFIHVLSLQTKSNAAPQPPAMNTTSYSAKSTSSILLELFNFAMAVVEFKKRLTPGVFGVSSCGTAPPRIETISTSIPASENTLYGTAASWVIGK